MAIDRDLPGAGPTCCSQMTRFFTSAFSFPGLSWTLILVAVAIGIIFGAIWLTPYRPPMAEKALALGGWYYQRLSNLDGHRFCADPLSRVGLDRLSFISGTSGHLRGGCCCRNTTDSSQRSRPGSVKARSRGLLLVAQSLAPYPQGSASSPERSPEPDWVYLRRFGFTTPYSPPAGPGVPWQRVAAMLDGILGKILQRIISHCRLALAGYGLAKRLGWQFT